MVFRCMNFHPAYNLLDDDNNDGDDDIDESRYDYQTIITVII